MRNLERSRTASVLVSFFPRYSASRWVKAKGGCPGKLRGEHLLKEAGTSALQGRDLAARCHSHLVAVTAPLLTHTPAIMHQGTLW